MNQFVIEIHPKKPEYDPLAFQVKVELIEAGESAQTALVQTRRLYRIEGDFTAEDAHRIAETLLVDPVVETAEIDVATPSKGKKKSKKVNNGWIVDIWPKPGVTDPVGETVQKGLKDLGFNGNFRASSAQRYVFPKINDPEKLRTLARRVLANELIHAIDIRKPH